MGNIDSKGEKTMCSCSTACWAKFDPAIDLVLTNLGPSQRALYRVSNNGPQPINVGGNNIDPGQTFDVGIVGTLTIKAGPGSGTFEFLSAAS